MTRLAALNRDFYETHALAFAESRPRPAPGVLRVIARLEPGARVLEAGCGDGKVARRLPPGSTYVGVDASEQLLARARALTALAEQHRAPAESAEAGAGRAPSILFLHADLLDPRWTDALPPGHFDWALALAVLHHLPGWAARAAVLAALAARLALGGTVVMSNWQLSRSPRLQQRRRPWAEAGLSEAEVEPGDWLLAWERAGRHGLRYVHEIDEAEARALAEAAGLQVAEVFDSDGEGGNLSQYAVMRRAS